MPSYQRVVLESSSADLNKKKMNEMLFGDFALGGEYLENGRFHKTLTQSENHHHHPLTYTRSKTQSSNNRTI